MKIIKIPGLIDPHVHLRDPGQTQKEDFYTGTMAALSGGFTTILDMPNNKIPVTTLKRLKEKISIAQKNIVCDVGFYFGSLGDNIKEFPKIQNKVFGLKLYLNQTTGNFLIDEKNLKNIFKEWSKINPKKPILVHAEEKSAWSVIEIVKKIKHPTHFCHVSKAIELKKIIKAKKEGLPVTCGVTPHHLFLTEKDKKNLGAFGIMKPGLATQKDQDFIWKNLSFVDCLESDHAPHTIEEKKSAVPPFGVPGLETTLPLLLTSVSKGWLTIEDIIRLCYGNPAKIFGVKQDTKTRIEVDLNKSYVIKNENLYTKCGWSPFNGWKVRGKVIKVFIRGAKVFDNGKIIKKAGFGKVRYAS